jgi:hypothetical protein
MHVPAAVFRCLLRGAPAAIAAAAASRGASGKPTKAKVGARKSQQKPRRARAESQGKPTRRPAKSQQKPSKANESQGCGACARTAPLGAVGPDRFSPRAPGSVERIRRARCPRLSRKGPPMSRNVYVCLRMRTQEGGGPVVPGQGVQRRAMARHPTRHPWRPRVGALRNDVGRMSVKVGGFGGGGRRVARLSRLRRR